MPLNPLTGPLGLKRATHFVRRTIGGGSIQLIDEFATLTANQALDRILASPVDQLPTPSPPIDPLTGTEWMTNGTSDANSEEFELQGYLNRWMVGQHLASGVADTHKLTYQFRERIVFFLHTLFTTIQSSVGNSRSVYFQQALFRQFALDANDIVVPNPTYDPLDPINTGPATLDVALNCKRLVQKLCLDNAMLAFLDGRLNVVGSPNENYAREMMELYTLGRGLEGTQPDPEFVGDYFFFTETDVQEAARVLSGFDVDRTYSVIDPETGLPRGVAKGRPLANRHDAGIKTFSNRLGDAVIQPNLSLPNSTPEDIAIDEINQLVDLIFNQTETAQHICRRIYRFFVYHEVTPSLEADIINDMAQVFVANNYKLMPVIRSLLSSTHFYYGAAPIQDDNFGGLIKSPLDLVIGFHNFFGLTVPDFNTDLTGFYQETGRLLITLDNQGLPLYEPYEVAGYSAYHQFPIYNRSWITTNYLTNRYQFIRERLSNGMNMEMGQVDCLSFVINNVDNSIVRNARALIIYLAEHLLPLQENLSFDEVPDSDITNERMNYFLTAFLFSPQLEVDPEAAWTDRHDTGSDPETRANQLTSLLNAMLQSPEYQLM
jgi:uncharacterized protein (DUF1800 family)